MRSNPDEIKAVGLDVEPLLTRGNRRDRCRSRVEEVLVVGRASLQRFAREVHAEDEEDEKERRSQLQHCNAKTIISNSNSQRPEK